MSGWLVRHASLTRIPLSTRNPACSASSTPGWMPSPATSTSATSSLPTVVRRGVRPRIDRRDPPPEVEHGAGRRRLAPDLLFGLALPQGLRERRAVVGWMRLGADQADRAPGVRLVEGLGRGVASHAAADKEIGIVGHRASARPLCAIYAAVIAIGSRVRAM